jgi:hypothetical protein
VAIAAELCELWLNIEPQSDLYNSNPTCMKERNAMAIESNGDEVVPTYNESYYEERASEEEIYLEETEEELRSKLISDTPQDDRPTLAPDTAFESYREVLASLFQD